MQRKHWRIGFSILNLCTRNGKAGREDQNKKILYMNMSLKQQSGDSGGRSWKWRMNDVHLLESSFPERISSSMYYCTNAELIDNSFNAWNCARIGCSSDLDWRIPVRILQYLWILQRLFRSFLWVVGCMLQGVIPSTVYRLNACAVYII